MKPQIWISKIKFSDSTELKFDKAQIIVFVGPNNTGKSLSLKEIDSLSRIRNNLGLVIKDIEIEKDGTEEELITLIEEESNKILELRDYRYHGFGFNVHGIDIKSNWVNYKNGLANIQPIFVHLLSTSGRLGAANHAINIALTKQPPSHPIHFLQKYDSIETKISTYFKQAFGDDLIVHRNAGNEVPLYVGKRPKPREGEDRLSIDYQKEVEKLPTLESQGDGMRSFVGVILNAFLSRYSILLIDEPEAFLYPSQIRLLGKMLARDLPSERQLFLATHSGDFIRGLLDANVKNLKIIRIQRNGNINKICELNNEEIKEIWNDTLLRHSNVLDGLFHTKVVVCESDSDCRFYSAVLNSMFDNENEISPDTLFIHCGGKHRLSSVVKSLKKLEVPVSVITDFDVLKDLDHLKKIYEELGGDWSQTENDWRLVKTSIDQKRPELETADLKKGIDGVFDSVKDKIFPEESVKQINGLLKKVSAWSHAKGVGKSFIPSGDYTLAYERIIQIFNLYKLFIVEVGELESFVKSVGNHGPAWVNEVLKKDLKNDPELEEARQFVKKIIV